MECVYDTVSFRMIVAGVEDPPQKRDKISVEQHARSQEAELSLTEDKKE